MSSDAEMGGGLQQAFHESIALSRFLLHRGIGGGTSFDPVAEGLFDEPGQGYAAASRFGLGLSVDVVVDAEGGLHWFKFMAICLICQIFHFVHACG